MAGGACRGGDGRGGGGLVTMGDGESSEGVRVMGEGVRVMGEGVRVETPTELLTISKLVFTETK